MKTVDGCFWRDGGTAERWSPVPVPRLTTRRTVLQTLAAAAGAASAAGATATRDQQSPFEPTTITTFDPPRLPENVAVGSDGTHYLSMAPIGEVWGLSPGGDVTPSAVASLPLARGNPNALLLGITNASDGALYACLDSRDPETHGVWRVPLGDGGDPTLVASTNPQGSTLNGITGDALEDGAFLVTDHQRGRILRVTRGGDVGVWLDSPLLDPNPYAATPIGVDGIDVGPDGAVWVDNLSFGSVLRIPVGSDGSAGTPEVFARSDALVGADGLTVDPAGDVYVAVNARDAIVRVDGNGEPTTLVSGGVLDFPSDVHFGRTAETRRTLYVTNFALPAARAEGREANPSYVQIDLESVETATATGTATGTAVDGATETTPGTTDGA